MKSAGPLAGYRQRERIGPHRIYIRTRSVGPPGTCAKVANSCRGIKYMEGYFFKPTPANSFALWVDLKLSSMVDKETERGSLPLLGCDHQQVHA